MVASIRQSNKMKLSVFLVLLSLVLAGCETEEEKAAGHLEKGRELLEKGDYAAAQLELKSAKQGNNSTADTYYYLALLDEKARHYLAMQDNLQKTLKLEPEHQQAQVKLGKLELLMGKVDKANEYADILLAKNAQDIEALVLKASVLLRQSNLEEAVVVINHIMELDPVNIDGLTLQATVLVQKDQLAEALVLIDKAIKEDEKNISLHVFKIKIHGKQKDVNAVINDYLVLSTLFPDNDNYKITLAKIYTQSNKVGEAEKLLRDLVVEKPRQLKPKLLLLSFLGANASDKVNQQIDTFTQQLSTQPRQLLDFTTWMVANDHLPKAEEILKQIVTEQGYSEVGVEANILLAKIAFDTEDFPVVQKIVADILHEVPDQLEAKLLQARLLLLEGQYAQAKVYLGKVIWSHPKSDEALVLLAQLYLVQGDRPTAYTKFKGALELNPANIQAFIPIYNSLIAKNDTRYAREILIKALRKSPQQAIFLQKLVELNIQEEKWQEAAKAATQLARKPRQKSLARFYIANIFQGQGECEKAVVIYKGLISEFPEQLRVYQRMSACYRALGKQSEMISLLNELLQKNKNNIAATIVLSDLYVDVKKYAPAINLLKGLVKSQPESILVRQKLAKIYIIKGEPDIAISVYQQGLQILPGNIRLSLNLSALYQQQKMYDKAVKIYEQLHTQYPDLQVASNNLAVLLVENFATDDNLQRAFQLVDSFATSEQAYYQDTYAWVLLHMGRVSEATDILKKLIVKSPDVAVFRYHLAVAEFKSGNTSSALAQVGQAQELAGQGENFPERELAEKLMEQIVDKMQGR